MCVGAVLLAAPIIADGQRHGGGGHFDGGGHVGGVSGAACVPVVRRTGLPAVMFEADMSPFLVQDGKMEGTLDMARPRRVPAMARRPLVAWHLRGTPGAWWIVGHDWYWYPTDVASIPDPYTPPGMNSGCWYWYDTYQQFFPDVGACPDAGKPSRHSKPPRRRKLPPLLRCAGAGANAAHPKLRVALAGSMARWRLIITDTSGAAS